MSETLDLPDDGSPTDNVVFRAHRRFARCKSWESIARQNWLMDIKFDAGDAYNNFQWPTDIYADRGSKPSLTVNETHQHNLHIINEAKQNKSGVKFRPTSGQASADSAEIYEGMYRHIANISNAQMAQGQAISYQVRGGLGYTLIEADYVDPGPKPGPEAFNQEIYIRGIANPMNVMIDCDAREIDGSDARYGFIFSDVPRDEVEEEYPELKGKLAVANSVDNEDGGWIRDNTVRVARYYEVAEDKDELIADDEGTTVYKSTVPAALVKQWEADAKASGTPLRRRPVIRKHVTCYKIIGNSVVEETDIPGTSVPIIPWVGEVSVIEQVLDRKGHTRCMISSQQMLNYNWSGSVEFGALQTKTPWLAPVAAIGDYMTYYSTSNVENHAVLPWVHRDEEGNEIPPPQRMPLPIGAPVFLEGVQLARQFMMAASGQFEAELGQPGNEKSGRAINERQRQSAKANYHFTDNQALAIRRQGQIIKDWIPVIYDTKRVAKIIGVDGTESEVMVDPNSPEAHREQRLAASVVKIFNPNVGTYEVVSDVGPDFATQRQEAFNAIVQVITQAPQLINQIGDLLFKASDFPMADEIAERLKPGLPPQAQAAITELQRQLQASNTRLGEAMQALTEERLKVKAGDQKANTDAFRADTDRAQMLLDAAVKVDPGMAQTMIAEMAQAAVTQALQDNLGPVRAASAPSLERDATGQPPPGATGGMPQPVPDPGRAAMTPGGQET